MDTLGKSNTFGYYRVINPRIRLFTTQDYTLGINLYFPVTRSKVLMYLTHIFLLYRLLKMRSNSP
jgi:hypothetical protein